jgi:hypothetical protein
LACREFSMTSWHLVVWNVGGVGGSDTFSVTFSVSAV